MQVHLGPDTLALVSRVTDSVHDTSVSVGECVLWLWGHRDVDCACAFPVPESGSVFVIDLCYGGAQVLRWIKCFDDEPRLLFLSGFVPVQLYLFEPNSLSKAFLKNVVGALKPILYW